MSETGASHADHPHTGDPHAPDPQRWAAGWRRVVLATGMLVYPLLTAVGLAQYAAGGALLAGYALVAGFCACYLLAALAVARRAWRRLAVLLGVMTALTVGVLPYAREFAFFLCAVVVSLTAAFFKRYAAPAVVIGALASVLVPWAVPGWDSGPGWFEAAALVFTALTVHAFAEIAATNRALLAARAEIALLASAAERDRIARDLHDLLGHSLTVITVKSALAHRLAPRDTARSVQEIGEVEELSRQALTDMRAAVAGYREVSLAGELARARDVLRTAGVTAELPADTGTVAPDHRELFGWVLREGLTNVVRHAGATRCAVTLTATRLEIRDDGAGRAPAAPGSGGHGIAGLRERAEAAGGTLEAGPLQPHGWRLRVTLGTPGGDV